MLTANFIEIAADLAAISICYIPGVLYAVVRVLMNCNGSIECMLHIIKSFRQ
jgi:hypothetical protein